jgi:hypothetical protein
MNKEDIERSASGAPIYRHDPDTARSSPVRASSQSSEMISQHIELHFGTAFSVFHELVSDLVHIDVNIVQPTSTRPHYTLVTSGMSDRPMQAPKESKQFRRAELMLCLPAAWLMDEGAFKDERNYWPIRCLKGLARLPHQYRTWLWESHTVPNGDPAKPYSMSTKLCCALLSRPQLVPEAFHNLEAGPGKIVHFFAVIPIYREEMELKLSKGVEALNERLQEAGVSELLDPNRVNVCKRSFFGRS